jgi:gluconate 2-dehydrogenase gamma chain
LKNLAVGVAAGPALQVLSVEAAEQAHRLVKLERGQAAGAYVPKFFTAHAFETVRSLCRTIIPADGETGGAQEAGAPEFIDLLTSENEDYKLTLGGGIAWLDLTCSDRYGKTSYLECTPAQQKEILDLIAYRENGRRDSTLNPGIKFFSLLRQLTADGFFTSEIGIKYLEYIGNTYLPEFPGCPPLPES